MMTQRLPPWSSHSLSYSLWLEMRMEGSDIMFSVVIKWDMLLNKSRIMKLYAQLYRYSS